MTIRLFMAASVVAALALAGCAAQQEAQQQQALVKQVEAEIAQIQAECDRAMGSPELALKRRRPC